MLSILKRYRLTFNYEFIENIDTILYNITIIQKSFDSNVSYIIEIEETMKERIFYYLLLSTSKQIKIEDLNKINNNFDFEPGTDKPIGSKSAIDEN